MKLRPLVQLILWTFDFLFFILARTRFDGRENLPERGPYLMVTNHLSYADAPLVAIGVRSPQMVALAADTYQKNPLFRWLVETVGGVWINRGSGDRGAIKAAVDTLKAGKILGIAPEGTRSKVTHALMKAKSGAAFIASKAGVPVVPIAVTGTQNIWRDLKRLRRAEVTFTIGPTFTLPPLDGNDKNKQLEEHTREMMCHIAALLPVDYRGAYLGDPRIEEIKKISDS